jgi:hypothetical protein
MEWGMIMAMFSVGGMLVLIFAQPQTERYQTFGREVMSPPETSTADAEEIQVKRAA